MFRGGDYVDNPKFYDNENMMIKNTLDNSVSTLFSFIYRTFLVLNQNLTILQNTCQTMLK